MRESNDKNDDYISSKKILENEELMGPAEVEDDEFKPAV
jgi:hypothetical protein